MKNSTFIQKLQKLNNQSTFLTLKNYKSSSGEVANYSLVFNINYENALKRSVTIIEKYIPEDNLEVKAKEEILASFNASLEKMKLKTDEEDKIYEHIYDANNKMIKGIKLNSKTDELYLYGFVVHKKVITSVSTKTVNKQALTLAKDKLRAMCPVSKFAQFKVKEDHVSEINVQNSSLLK